MNVQMMMDLSSMRTSTGSLTDSDKTPYLSAKSCEVHPLAPAKLKDLVYLGLLVSRTRDANTASSVAAEGFGGMRTRAGVCTEHAGKEKPQAHSSSPL